MGKLETNSIKKLLEIQYGDRFDYHPKFLEEFDDFIHRSGKQKAIIKQLASRLNMILQMNDLDCGKDWLEHLKKHGNMYSLHIDTCGTNYRLLFSKTPTKKFFLHVFYEKEDSTMCSYDKHVPIAINRRDNWNEEESI